VHQPESNTRHKNYRMYWCQWC